MYKQLTNLLKKYWKNIGIMVKQGLERWNISDHANNQLILSMFAFQHPLG